MRILHLIAIIVISMLLIAVAAIIDIGFSYWKYQVFEAKAVEMTASVPENPYSQCLQTCKDIYEQNNKTIENSN